MKASFTNSAIPANSTQIKSLQCVVDTGTFECLGPDSWMYDGGGCLHFETECD